MSTLTTSSLSLSPIGSLSGKSGFSVDLLGEAFGLALNTKLTVIVGHCLPFFTNVKKSIRAFAVCMARG